jgi:hypothetical protein
LEWAIICLISYSQPSIKIGQNYQKVTDDDLIDMRVQSERGLRRPWRRRHIDLHTSVVDESKEDKTSISNLSEDPQMCKRDVPALRWTAHASAGNRTRGWPTFQNLRSWMATANFTTKPPMLDESASVFKYRKSYHYFRRSKLSKANRNQGWPSTRGLNKLHHGHHLYA